MYRIDVCTSFCWINNSFGFTIFYCDSFPYIALQGTMSCQSGGSVCAAGNCIQSGRNSTIYGFPIPHIDSLKALVDIVLQNKEFGTEEACANKLSEKSAKNTRDTFRWLHAYAKVDPITKVPLIFSSWSVYDFKKSCNERYLWWKYCGRAEPIGSIWLHRLFLCERHFSVCFLLPKSI